MALAHQAEPGLGNDAEKPRQRSERVYRARKAGPPPRFYAGFLATADFREAVLLAGDFVETRRRSPGAALVLDAAVLTMGARFVFGVALGAGGWALIKPVLTTTLPNVVPIAAAACSKRCSNSSGAFRGLAMSNIRDFIVRNVSRRNGM